MTAGLEFNRNSQPYAKVSPWQKTVMRLDLFYKYSLHSRAACHNGGMTGSSFHEYQYRVEEVR
jgi:hypothetical protein